MVGDQRDRRLGAEVDVGLVDHHRDVAALARQPRDLGAAQRDAGRRVRVGDDDRAAAVEVVVDAHPHVIVQRHGLVLDAQQPAIDRIEAVSDVGKEQGPRLFQQGREGMRQHLVRAVAHEDLFGRYLVIVGQRLAQVTGARIGIEPQRISRRPTHRLQRLGRRPERALIGVQLHQAGDLGLLARHIG